MKYSETILVITDLENVPSVKKQLQQLGHLIYLPDASPAEALDAVRGVEYIFTNPNNSKVFIGREMLGAATKLRAVCTASTGLTHVDVTLARAQGVEVLSLTKEMQLLRQLASTAELALGLTISLLRHLVPAANSVQKGHWDYRKFMGKQVRNQKIGIVGLGRLGSMYARYVAAMGAEVMVYDPYVTSGDVETQAYHFCENIIEMFESCDVISLHAHANEETKNIINPAVLAVAKEHLVLINTARGELVDEQALIKFLNANPKACYGADVVSDETLGGASSPIVQMSLNSSRVIVTPHIGGMTLDGQALAYAHAAKMLARFVEVNQM